FQVRWNQLSFGGVTITGTIAGPGPVTLSAKFSIGLLFWSIDWSDSWTLGSAPVSAPPPVGSVAQKMHAELGEPANRFADAASDAVDHPYTVTEIRLPKPPRTVGSLPFPVLILDGVLARTGAAGVRTTAAAVSVGEESFVVRGADGSVLRSASSQTDA